MNKIKKSYMITSVVVIIFLCIVGLYFYVNRNGVSLDKNIFSIRNTRLSWSSDMGKMNWETARVSCASIGNGWRLPTKEELRTALFDQFKNGGSNPGGFQNNTYYWSGSVYDSGTAWLGYTYDVFLGYGNNTRGADNSVRCVY